MIKPEGAIFRAFFISSRFMYISRLHIKQKKYTFKLKKKVICLGYFEICNYLSNMIEKYNMFYSKYEVTTQTLGGDYKDALILDLI